MKQIILASSSIRRRELLEKTGLEFIVVSADIDETPKSDEQAEDLVKRLSKEKAEKIALRYSEAIIIAADTEVVLENEIFGKPKDEHHAKEMLAKLSGKTHQVITGFTILDTQTNKQTTEMVKTFVTFKKIDERQIAEYVATKKPFDKSGSYGIQEIGETFVEIIDGDIENVMGLPTKSVIKILQTLNY